MKGGKIWRTVLLILLAVILCCPVAPAFGEENDNDEDDENDYSGWTRFEQPSGGTYKEPRMQYWVYTPEDMEPGLPLVIYLHSSFGLVGKALRDAMPVMIRDGRMPKPDCVVLVPQLTGNYNNPHQWEEVFGSLIPIIEKVVKEYEVDETRIALTGYSLGGIGVFDLAVADRGRYAKIMSVCGKCHYPVLDAVDAFAGTEVLVLTAQYDTTVNSATAVTFAGMLQEAGITAYHEELPYTHGELPFAVYTQKEVQEWLWLIPSISEKPADETGEEPAN